VVIYEAALLVETGRYRELDGLIVVEAPRAVRRQRLIAREGFSPELADRILDTQIPDETRRKASSELLENDGTLEELSVKVMTLIAKKSWKN
jgi:dephospho-CoA kinase